MSHDEHRAKQDHLERHSLPGTNQAGKGPGKREDTAKKGSAKEAQDQDRLEKHSLPGTNQAGKGPSDGPPR